MTDALTLNDTLALRRSHGHVASARPASRERVTRVGFRHYKVSPSGQLTLPPEARASLGVSRGGYVDVYQTGQGVVVKRTAIDRAGRSKRSLINRPPSVRAYPDMHRYKVSGLGQLSLAAETRRAWSLDGGGVVEAACVGPVVVVLPIGQASLLLREWLGRPMMSSASVIRISSSLYSDNPWEQWCTSKKLVAGSLLADLMCGDARADDVRSSTYVTWPEYSSFARSSVESLFGKDMPGQMETLALLSAERLGTPEWLALLLDVGRVRGARGMAIEFVTDTGLAAAEAAVLTNRWGVSTRMATNLIVARDSGMPLYVPLTTSTPGVEAAIEHLGLVKGRVQLQRNIVEETS